MEFNSQLHVAMTMRRRIGQNERNFSQFFQWFDKSRLTNQPIAIPIDFRPNGPFALGTLIAHC